MAESLLRTDCFAFHGLRRAPYCRGAPLNEKEKVGGLSKMKCVYVEDAAFLYGNKDLACSYQALLRV